MNFKVCYMDRKGAGCVRMFARQDDMLNFVSRLKTEACIYRNDVKIGNVWRSSGEVDDRRVKWLWAFESHEGEASASWRA